MMINYFLGHLTFLLQSMEDNFFRQDELCPKLSFFSLTAIRGAQGKQLRCVCESGWGTGMLVQVCEHGMGQAAQAGHVGSVLQGITAHSLCLSLPALTSGTSAVAAAGYPLTA